MGGGNPEHVGVEQKEEDETEGHEVHVDAEEDAAVVEVPAALHAADGVQRARYSDEGRKDDQRSGVVVGEVREEKGRCQAKKNKDVAA